MKYVAAGLTASAVFFTSYLLLIFAEEPFRDLMSWLDLDPYWEMRWWRAGTGLIMAGYVFRAFITWRNNAALEWRRTLAARARA
ncbi:hypothetical protein [Microvirga sp. M2]|uniref:hypothetical protein n=1 Tax=Microvirga sp. M2 TaxID=3073270 RepID=UPI0039C08DD5